MENHSKWSSNSYTGLGELLLTTTIKQYHLPPFLFGDAIHFTPSVIQLLKLVALQGFMKQGVCVGMHRFCFLLFFLNVPLFGLQTFILLEHKKWVPDWNSSQRSDFWTTDKIQLLRRSRVASVRLPARCQNLPGRNRTGSKAPCKCSEIRNRGNLIFCQQPCRFLWWVEHGLVTSVVKMTLLVLSPQPTQVPALSLTSEDGWNDRTETAELYKGLLSDDPLLPFLRKKKERETRTTGLQRVREHHVTHFQSYKELNALLMKWRLQWTEFTWGCQHEL